MSWKYKYQKIMCTMCTLLLYLCIGDCSLFLNLFKVKEDVYDMNEHFVVIYGGAQHRVIRKRDCTAGLRYYMKTPKCLGNMLHEMCKHGEKKRKEKRLLTPITRPIKSLPAGYARRLFFYRCIAVSRKRDDVFPKGTPFGEQLGFYMKKYRCAEEYAEDRELSVLFREKPANENNYMCFEKKCCNENCTREFIDALVCVYNDMAVHSSECSLDLAGKGRSTVLFLDPNDPCYFPSSAHHLEAIAGCMNGTIRVVNGQSCSFYFRLKYRNTKMLKRLISKLIEGNRANSELKKEYSEWCKQ